MTSPNDHQLAFLQMIVDAGGVLRRAADKDVVETCVTSGWVVEHEGEYALTLAGADVLRPYQEGDTATIFGGSRPRRLD